MGIDNAYIRHAGWSRSAINPPTQVLVRCAIARRGACYRARQHESLIRKGCAAWVDEYLGELEALFSPELFILGDGVSKKQEEFIPLLSPRSPLVAVQLVNRAGIVGAASVVTAQPEVSRQR